MSAHNPLNRKSVTALRAMKGAGSLVSLTAYSTSMAKLVDPFVDLLIVGDSLGMVMYGMPSTLAVTLDMMIAHGRAVMLGSTQACVAIDLPFSTYQESPAQAFRSAARLLSETGAQAVKLEGGAEMADTIRFLIDRGVPVVAHIGLMPQQVNAMGGFRAQGYEANTAERIFNAALAVEHAGAFCVVIEATTEMLARKITESLTIPTIGIGASPACDGQVLVTEDLLGIVNDYVPRFVKRYADIGTTMREAVAQYANEVRHRVFPEAKHCFAYGKPLTYPRGRIVP